MKIQGGHGPPAPRCRRPCLLHKTERSLKVTPISIKIKNNCKRGQEIRSEFRLELLVIIFFMQLSSPDENKTIFSFKFILKGDNLTLLVLYRVKIVF